MANPTSGQAPLNVQFTTQSSGAITAWAWNFGDGTGSTEQSPAHTYMAAGHYTVSLTVTGPGGSDTETKVSYINVTMPPAPVAAFTANPTSGQAPLNVQFTDQSSGVIAAWSWDFGDGTSSTDQSPAHTYMAGAYTVSLTVSGPGGSHTETKADYITVTAPPAPTAKFTAEPTSGQFPLNVQFTDNSEGDITAWSWDFGDGTGSTEQSPAHTYTAAGNYTVSLTVTGPGGSDTKTKPDFITVLVPPAPKAKFNAEPTTGQAPLTVQFNEKSEGEYASCLWDFGDGNTSTEENPSHTYQNAGLYTVSLTVTGPGGSDTKTKPNFITVTEPATPELPAPPPAPFIPIPEPPPTELPAPTPEPPTPTPELPTLTPTPEPPTTTPEPPTPIPEPPTPTPEPPTATPEPPTPTPEPPMPTPEPPTPTLILLSTSTPMPPTTFVPKTG
jgi:PKD repeat protein